MRTSSCGGGGLLVSLPKPSKDRKTNTATFPIGPLYLGLPLPSYTAEVSMGYGRASCPVSHLVDAGRVTGFTLGYASPIREVSIALAKGKVMDKITLSYPFTP